MGAKYGMHDLNKEIGSIISTSMTEAQLCRRKTRANADDPSCHRWSDKMEARLDIERKTKTPKIHNIPAFHCNPLIKIEASQANMKGIYNRHATFDTKRILGELQHCVVNNLEVNLSTCEIAFGGGLENADPENSDGFWVNKALQLEQCRNSTNTKKVNGALLPAQMTPLRSISIYKKLPSPCNLFQQDYISSPKVKQYVEEPSIVPRPTSAESKLWPSAADCCGALDSASISSVNSLINVRFCDGISPPRTFDLPPVPAIASAFLPRTAASLRATLSLGLAPLHRIPLPERLSQPKAADAPCPATAQAPDLAPAAPCGPPLPGTPRCAVGADAPSSPPESFQRRPPPYARDHGRRIEPCGRLLHRPDDHAPRHSGRGLVQHSDKERSPLATVVRRALVCILLAALAVAAAAALVHTDRSRASPSAARHHPPPRALLAWRGRLEALAGGGTQPRTPPGGWIIARLPSLPTHLRAFTFSEAELLASES